MIREIGIRPAGVTMRHCSVTSETVVYLDGRELFRFSDLLQMCAQQIAIDWNDLRTPPLLDRATA